MNKRVYNIAMQYVVLLRGINVGGNNKVSMSTLKTSLLRAGFEDVKTYINSGNLLLKSNLPLREVNYLVEDVIEKTFGFKVYALTLEESTFKNIANTISNEWMNNSDMKCDVMFLWPDINNSKIMEKLIIKPGIDNIKYVAGAILWSINRVNINKSGLLKIVGTDIYKKITVRNCNTVRKLNGLLDY